MSETKEIEKHQPGPLDTVKQYLANPDVKNRLEEMLGKRSSAFANSVINVISSNKQLREVAVKNPNSIMRAVIKAATVNMPIEPALGWAAIVPYGDEAVFQFMYKGVTQLCIRSGQYKTLNCTEVYGDELKSYNPISGEVKFNDLETFKHRYEEDRDKYVVGHYVYFQLLSGFEHSGYMTHKEVLAHAKKYSKAYQYDLKFNKKTSAWSTDPIPMGNKTVLLRELKRYGIMSVEMQDAIAADQETFDEAQANAARRIEAEQGSEPIDVNFEPKDDEQRDPETQAKIDEQKKALQETGKEVDDKVPGKARLYYFICPECERTYEYGAKAGIGVKCECGKATIIRRSKYKKQDNSKKDKSARAEYHCDNCNKDFENPTQIRDTNDGPEWQCPHCLSWRVHRNGQEEDTDFMND